MAADFKPRCGSYRVITGYEALTIKPVVLDSFR